MFKIGEFSKITQVSIRMLRYYDENGLLTPDKVDEITGYRMYSGSQIEELNRILFLKNLGFHVKKIKQLLHAWEPNQIMQELEMQKRDIESMIKSENEKLLRIQASISDLERHNLYLNTQIVIKSIPSYTVISLRRLLPNYFSEYMLWKELCEKLPETKGLPCFSIYHDLDYKENDVDIEACIINEGQYKVKRKDIELQQTEAIERAACFNIYGPYANISIACKEFGIWLDSHSEYRICGKNRQICHVSSCDTNNPDEYITELQVPIEIINT